MTDLKLIDELLVDLRQGRTWKELEESSSVTRAAFKRLREAWRSGRMKMITLGLATYFDSKPTRKERPCHWCRRIPAMSKVGRWTGWWAKPRGWKRFHPACSHHAGIIQIKQHGLIQLRRS